MPKDGGIGASTKRREDVRFLTGTGNYTDDINLRGQAYVHFLRSDVAHGKINGIDTSGAEAMPGVIRIFTGKDFESAGSIPCGWQVTDKHGQPMQEPKHPIMAEGKIRHVGEIIAAVVADSLEYKYQLEQSYRILLQLNKSSGNTLLHLHSFPLI